MSVRLYSRVMRFICGLLLLIAAVLKGSAGPIEGLGIWAHVVLVDGEVSLAVLIVAGVWQSAVLRLAVGCFGFFGIYSLVKAIGGAATCGCFGRMEVNPWFTAVMDCVLMVSLGVVACKSGRLPVKQTSWKRVGVAVAGWACLSIIILWSCFGRTPATFADASIQNTVSSLGTASGNLIVLEPEHWAGKPFALADFIPHGETLGTGRWVVLIYHNGCSTCQQALPAFKSARERGAGTNPKVAPVKIALIELPPHEAGDLGGWGDLNASLPDTHDWFATTPIAVAVEDGVVKSTVSGEAAIDPKVLIRQAGFDR